MAGSAEDGGILDPGQGGFNRNETRILFGQVKEVFMRSGLRILRYAAGENAHWMHYPTAHRDLLYSERGNISIVRDGDPILPLSE